MKYHLLEIVLLGRKNSRGTLRNFYSATALVLHEFILCVGSCKLISLALKKKLPHLDNGEQFNQLIILPLIIR